jgi:hypothetical protein
MRMNGLRQVIIDDQEMARRAEVRLNVVHGHAGPRIGEAEPQQRFPAGLCGLDTCLHPTERRTRGAGTGNRSAGTGQREFHTHPVDDLGRQILPELRH